MEHKKKDNIELIEHIQDTLQHYSEEYKPGAWENFKKTQGKESKKVVPLWRWASVAAAVVVCLSALLFLSKDPVVENTIVDHKGGNTEFNQDVHKVNEPPVSELNADVSGSDRKLAYRSNSLKITTALADSDPVMDAPAIEDRLAVVADVVSQATTNAIAANVKEDMSNDQSVNSAASDLPASSSTSSSITHAPAMELAKEKADRQHRVKFNNNKRWTLGLMVAPALSQNVNEVNLGFGLSVNYALSKKLSLSSGITYNKMDASKNLPTNLGTSSIVLNNNKKLAVISEEVSGIDMPFELKYQFTPKIYANFGLSGFAVINQQRSNTFIQDVVVNRSENLSASSSLPAASAGLSSSSKADPLGPQGQFANAFIVRKRTTENVASQAVDNIDFLGFYNFSIGYSRKIYKQNTLAIEPFFKLPIREVTQDNLRMVGTGVRIKVGF